MKTDSEHPLITFAGTYGDPTLDYLNAHMAIERLDVLREDLSMLTDLLESKSPKDQRWQPWFGAEAISYYAVGYATCLEWHAKSRLVDLLTYRPTALLLSDVQKTISDKMIVQMVAKQASVTQLVGAALKISNLDSYLSVIIRVFKELDFPCSLADWLTGNAADSCVCWIRAEQMATVDRLFEFRHYLVHEIGIGTMGHPNVRDAWAPDEAKRIGGVIASVMYGIEAALTRYAPSLFPNLLTEERWPVGSTTSLMDEFNRLDATADASVRHWQWEEGRTAKSWETAREKFAEYLAAEEDFITSAGMLHWRYFDARTPLRLKLLRYRIDFLTELLSHFTMAEADNPEGGGPLE